MLNRTELIRLSILLAKYRDNAELYELITLAHTYNSSRADNSLLAFKELLIEAYETKEVEDLKSKLKGGKE